MSLSVQQPTSRGYYPEYQDIWNHINKAKWTIQLSVLDQEMQHWRLNNGKKSHPQLATYSGHSTKAQVNLTLTYQSKVCYGLTKMCGNKIFYSDTVTQIPWSMLPTKQPSMTCVAVFCLVLIRRIRQLSPAFACLLLTYSILLVLWILLLSYAYLYSAQHGHIAFILLCSNMYVASLICLLLWTKSNTCFHQTCLQNIFVLIGTCRCTLWESSTCN